MANRIETATVTGETIKLSSKNAGTAGSYNAVTYAFSFDSTWDGTTKKITFFNCFGLNPKTIVLTTNLLVDGKYMVPIPAEPLEFAGEFPVTVRGVELEADGVTAKRIIISAHTVMVSKETDIPTIEDAPVEPTPTQTEQLNAAIGTVTGLTATAVSLSPGSAPTVTKSTNIDGTYNFEFGIPQGVQGPQGGLLPQIVVTAPVGANITVTDGTTVITGVSAGAYTIEVSNYADWTVSATFDGETKSTVVTVDTVKIYPVVLTYTHIYGFTINEAESNPLTSVVYTDEAVGFEKGSYLWDSSPLFKNIKPCLFKDGTVVGYLQKNDYSKFEDGTPADITSGNAGDVMIEIPKMAYYIEKNNNLITCKVYTGSGAEDVDNRYTYLPFSRVTEGDVNKIYVGAYVGFTIDSKLRSLSGKSPAGNLTISTFRTQAQANGTGYQQFTFYTLTLLQMLYIIKYGSLNSQVALGRGFVDGNAAAINTGGTDTRGFCYGESTGKIQNKLFGIEDFWGNKYVWIDGVFSDASRNILSTYKAFNNTGAGYLFSVASGIGSDVDGYVSTLLGTSNTGFVANNRSGSESTYYTDRAGLTANSVAFYGSDYALGSSAGIFRLNVGLPASVVDPSVGARLCHV